MPYWAGKLKIAPLDEPGVIVPEEETRRLARGSGAVAVSFTAGAGAKDDIPASD